MSISQVLTANAGSYFEACCGLFNAAYDFIQFTDRSYGLPPLDRLFIFLGYHAVYSVQYSG